MKTSILYGTAISPRRACLPHESKDGKNVPRFVPAYWATIGHLGSLKTTKEWQPDRLGMSGYQFDLQRSGVIKPFKTSDNGYLCDAKIIPQEFVDRLDALDMQIADLERQRRELLQEAWPYGKRINANQFKKQ
jgi:hypothetical protein